MTGSKLALILVPGLLLAGVAGAVAGVRYRDDVLRLVTGQAWVPAQTAPAFISPATANASDDKVYYTCSMHRSIIRDKPGFCPICGMPLDAIHVHADQAPTATVRIDPVTVQNMGVRTAPVIEAELRQTVRAVGTLVEPEQNHLEVNLRVSGWIQKLYANQNGMVVQAGDPLFDLYSPEITAAAEELISARKAFASADGKSDPVMERTSATVLAAGKRKLELLGLPAAQIDAIAKMDKAPATVTFNSPIHGHIAAKMVNEGSSVKPGEVLMEIADRSTMWLQLQVYEQQIGLVSVGQKVRAKVAAFPEKVFEGKVDFVYPHLDTATRSATVRVVLNNSEHRLHENMYATAEIEVPAQARSLLVPREAVIDTGRRQVVFVADGDGRFTARDVTTGRSGRIAPGDPEVVQVAYGLSAGETVVTSGQFLLDSESRMQEASQKFLPIGDAASAATPDKTPATPPMSPRHESNAKVTGLIAAYLPLAAKLGAPQTESTPMDVQGVLSAAEALAQEYDAALKAAGEQLVAATRAMEHQPIDRQRAAFKLLSKQVVGLAKSEPLPPAMGKLYAFRCTMDNSEWLQRTATPENPYFPVEMKTCGEITQAIEQPDNGGTPGSAGTGPGGVEAK